MASCSFDWNQRQHGQATAACLSFLPSKLHLVVESGIVFISVTNLLLAQPSLSNGIVVTEIMNHGPTLYPSGNGFIANIQQKPALITQVSKNDTSWIEVYNPWNKKLVLTSMSIYSKPEWSKMSLGDKVIKPGGYIYLCETSRCSPLSQKVNEVFHIPVMDLNSNDDGVAVYSILKPKGNDLELTSTLSELRTEVQSAVAWGKVNSGEFLVQKPLENTPSNIIKRLSGPDGCPQVTFKSNIDFSSQTQPNFKDFKHCNAVWPRDLNEYIEIYNASDHPIDPVKAGYKIGDNLNSAGESVDHRYSLSDFDHYSYTEKTTLQPGQVGLIIRPNADTRSLSLIAERNSGINLSKKIKERKVKLYSTEDSKGHETFLTDGLHNSFAEYLSFERPGMVPPLRYIPQKHHGWKISSVDAFQAMVKNSPLSANSPENWDTTLLISPGEIRNK